MAEYSVDLLLAAHVSPVMKSAGYRRAGRKYVFEGADRSAVVLTFRRFDRENMAGFLVDWAIVPRALRDFYNRSAKNDSAVQVYWGMVYKNLDPINEWGNPRTGYWEHSWDPVDRDRCGRDLGQILQTKWIPHWLTLVQDREALVWEIAFAKEPPFNVGHWNGDPWRTLFLTIDDGNAEELAGLIDEADLAKPGSVEVQWFRQRLAARLAQS